MHNENKIKTRITIRFFDFFEILNFLDDVTISCPPNKFDGRWSGVLEKDSRSSLCLINFTLIMNS